MENKTILRVEDLIKRYGAQFSLEIPHLEFQEGKLYALTGPNGAGKTTLLSILSLLEEPTEGEIFFREKKITSSPTLRLNIRRKMSMVMENPLFFHTTVFKNITRGLKCHSVDKKLWRERAEEALRMVGLEGFEKRDASHLSRGETQRAAIARALALRPKVLLLDEPFTNIDKRNEEAIEELIRTINERFQTTIIFTTHDLGQTYRLSHEVISLVGGKIVKGSLENLFRGEVEGTNELRFVRLSPSVKIAVVTLREGKVDLSVAPQDIILSRHPLESSARNSFKGIIKTIHLEGQTVRISVETGGGTEFIAVITKASLEEMNLSLGSPIFLTFKTTSVTIF